MKYFVGTRIEESNCIKSKSKRDFLVESTRMKIETFHFKKIDENRNRTCFQS